VLLGAVMFVGGIAAAWSFSEFRIGKVETKVDDEARARAALANNLADANLKLIRQDQRTICLMGRFVSSIPFRRFVHESRKHFRRRVQIARKFLHGLHGINCHAVLRRMARKQEKQEQKGGGSQSSPPKGPQLPGGFPSPHPSSSRP
jgi:hypothetical protein